MPPVKKPSRKRLKTFLKEWRLSRKMNQEEVAKRLEVDRSTVSRIERSETPYDQDLLEKFALIYDCKPEDLLSINPIEPDLIRLLYSKLGAATPEQQKMALNLIDLILSKNIKL